MPKMKTKSGAKKRFVVRPGGTVKRGSAFKRHILTKKTTKNKRRLLCKKARDGVFAWKSRSEKSAMNSLFINLTGICATKKPINLLTFWENGYIIRPTETNIRKIRRKGGEQTWTGM